jgi:orotate phosphoribosyltransferase-like protein
MSDEDFPYRSLSSIARSLLPKAKEMHEQGISWKNVARQLRVSNAALFIWRKIESRQRASLRR